MIARAVKVAENNYIIQCNTIKKPRSVITFLMTGSFLKKNMTALEIYKLALTKKKRKGPLKS